MSRWVPAPIRCQWGHGFVICAPEERDTIDTTACMEQAVQRFHFHVTDGREVVMQFCAEHEVIVRESTTPTEGYDEGGDE